MVMLIKKHPILLLLAHVSTGLAGTVLKTNYRMKNVFLVVKASMCGRTRYSTDTGLGYTKFSINQQLEMKNQYGQVKSLGSISVYL